jgi:hypothetical protein
MNRNTLTLLGCSGVLVLALNSPAIADSLSSQTLQPGNYVGVTTTSGNAQNAVLDPSSDTVGDLAIAKFHCDCPACRMAVVQLVQTGQLSL